MREKNLHFCHIVTIVAIILFVICPLRIHAKTTIDRLLVTDNVPSDTVDGIDGKRWSVTENNHLVLGKTFYFAFDGIMFDSDCSIYVVITDPYGTEYSSDSRGFSFVSGTLISGILGKSNLSVNCDLQEDSSVVKAYGYHWNTINTTKPSGIYTGTLHVGDQQKSYSWYMIDTPIIIQSNPDDVSVQINDSATFYVGASGSNLSYQWYYNDKKSSVGGVKIKGADGPSYTVSKADTSLDGKYYYCELSNYSDTEKYDIVTVQTVPAKLTVNKLDPIVSAFESKTAYDGKNHLPRVVVTGPDDYTVYYSTSSKLNQNNYMTGSTTCPSRNSVGTTTVYFYIHDNQSVYKDYAGTTSITILGNSSLQTEVKKAKNVAAKKPDLKQKGYLLSVKSPKKGVLRLKWKKISKVTGYQFFVSTDKTFTSHTLKKTYKKKLTKVLIKKCPSKKVFYVKMRPYKKKNGKTLYGYWSKIKKVKIK